MAESWKLGHLLEAQSEKKFTTRRWSKPGVKTVTWLQIRAHSYRSMRQKYEDVSARKYSGFLPYHVSCASVRSLKESASIKLRFCRYNIYFKSASDQSRPEEVSHPAITSLKEFIANTNVIFDSSFFYFFCTGSEALRFSFPIFFCEIKYHATRMSISTIGR